MYIEKIKSPADLKELDLKALQMVADETRQAVLKDRKSTRLNSSHCSRSRMPSSA